MLAPFLRMAIGVSSHERRRTAPAALLLLPGFIALAAGLVLATLDGGYPAQVWCPAALFLLALLALSVMLAVGLGRPRPRLVVVALACYALFCAWSYLSIIWADAPGDAWNGANRAALYGIVLLLVTLRPWPPRQALGALYLVGFGISLIAAVVVAYAVLRSDPSRFFLEGRLAEPASYLNATADLWLIGFWPLAHLASSSMPRWPPRVLALALATALLQIAVLSQSRGSAIAFGATAVVYLVVVRRRFSALLALAVAVGLTALSFDTLTAVREVREASGLGPALDDAAAAIALSALAAGPLAALAMLLARVTRERAGLALPRRAGDLAVAAVGVAALVVVLAAIGNPGSWLDERWNDFRSSGYTSVDVQSTRFGGSLGSGRYDYWRVALNEFRDHPVTGIGADNFSGPYLEHRRTLESPRHPHSLAFRLLSQVGAVGTALFLAFLGLMLAATSTAIRRLPRTEAGLAAAAFAGFAMWFMHSLGDWLWEFPALGVLALGLLGLSASIREDPLPPLPPLPPQPETGRRPARSWPLRAVGVVAVLAAALSFAFPGVSARYTSAAYETARTDPALALKRLDRAAELNPLSADPVLARGVIARRVGSEAVARAALSEAVEREPKNWYARFELALAYLRDGRRALAARELAATARLNPRQPLVGAARGDFARGRRVDANDIEARLYDQLKVRLRATDPGRGR